MHALDRIEQDCRRKVQEEDTSNATQRGHLSTNTLFVFLASILKQLICLGIIHAQSLYKLFLYNDLPPVCHVISNLPTFEMLWA